MAEKIDLPPQRIEATDDLSSAITEAIKGAIQAQTGQRDLTLAEYLELSVRTPKGIEILDVAITTVVMSVLLTMNPERKPIWHQEMLEFNKKIEKSILELISKDKH